MNQGALTKVKKLFFVDTKLSFAVAIFAILLTSCSNVVDVDMTKLHEKPMNADITNKLQQILDQTISHKDTQFSGMILRLESPQGVFLGAAGVNDIDSNGEIDPQAKFRGASILKPFIATVTLQLMEEKKLSLNDKLSQLLPASITKKFEYSNDITVKMLLNHTSGIGEWVSSYEDLLGDNNLEKVWTAQEFIDLAVKAGTKFKPGERYEYNNTEYTLLGMIIESKTAMSWRENVRRRIINPLNLQNTSLPEPGDTKMPGVFIQGYQKLAGKLINTTEIDASMAGAAGGHSFVTNTTDLAIFIQALFNGELFDDNSTLDIMLEKESGSEHGLGIGRHTMPNGSYAWGHTGGTAGYASLLFYLPKEAITISTVLTTDQSGVFPHYLFPALNVITNEASE